MLKDRLLLQKPGAVKPAGWLREWACAAARGYTGHMTDVDEEFVRAWREDFQPQGKKLNWSEGTWSFEGGTYWFDGLIRLAYQLDDDELKELARRRMAPVLDNMNDHAIGFCWWLNRDNETHQKDAQASSWMFNWVAGMFARPMAAWYQATGDAKAAEALEQAMGSDYWLQLFNNTPTLPSGTYEAWRVTHNSAFEAILKALGKKLPQSFQLSHYNLPPADGLEKSLYLKRKQQYECHLPSRHGVITHETLNSVFAVYRATGNQELLQALRQWYKFLDTHSRQPFGTTVMDEEWGLPGPGRASETCAIAAELWTRINLLAGLGEGSWGDDIERAVFNAVPACVDRDWKTHVYMQLPNRLEASPWQRFSVADNLEKTCAKYDIKHYPLCCTAGLNRLLPEYIQSLWMTTSDGGVAATLYGPCTFSTTIQDAPFAISEYTDYPFNDTISIRITAVPNRSFPLYLRLPGWCQAPEIRLNGTAMSPSSANGFAVINRQWKVGDVITLRFPMVPVVEPMVDYDETQKAFASISAGPLLFARGFAETTPNEPAETPFVPHIKLDSILQDAQLSVAPLPTPWNWPLESPVTLTVRDADGNPLTLVPYGCTKLRASLLELH